LAEYLPPMSGGQGARIVPGPVSGGACPPPSELVVEVRKVFDFCFQQETLDRCFVVPGLGPGAAVTDCQITNVTCQEALPREPLQDQEGLSVVSVQRAPFPPPFDAVPPVAPSFRTPGGTCSKPNSTAASPPARHLQARTCHSSPRGSETDGPGVLRTDQRDKPLSDRPGRRS
jgi:hypothetical protein